MGLTVQKLKPSRMFQHVVEQLEAAIVAGTLPPGEPLPPEYKLKEMFETSRGTIREALRILEEKGLVEVRVGVGGGAFVKKPDTGKVIQSLDLLLRFQSLTFDHLAEFRRGIEGQIAELAAMRITPKGADKLRSLVREAESALELETETGPDEFMKMDIAVHVAIAEIAANPLFTALSEMVHEKILGAYDEFSIGEDGRLEENCTDLAALVEAVVRGDAGTAGELARTHVDKYNRYMKAQSALEKERRN